MITYEIVESLIGPINSINKLINGEVVLSFAEDEANTDYQAYLAWVEENK